MSPTSERSAKKVINVNDFFSGGRFNGFQAMWLWFSGSIHAMDGYDMYVYAGTIPLIVKEFHINYTWAGALATYMLTGATIAALILAPISDKVGRKKVLVWSILVFCIGMTGTALSHTATNFAIWRFITGLGYGGSLANMSPLTNEYIPGKKRGIMMGLAVGGIQIGAMVAAILELVLFPRYGWRPVYYIGAAFILALPFIIRYMPESPTRLVRAQAFEKMRAIMRKARPDFDVPADAVLEIDKDADKAPLKAIFQEGRAFSTILLFIAWFMNMYTVFGLTVWIPKLVMDRGFSLARGLTVMITMSITAVVAAAVVGAVADKFGFKRTLSFFFLLTACLIVSVGYAHSFTSLMILISLAGAGSNGASNCFNGYMSPYYPPSMRSTANGYGWGFSRVGALTGPVFIGFLMSLHWGYHSTLFMLAFPGVLSVICILLVNDKHDFSLEILRKERLADAAKAAAKACVVQ